MRRLTFAALLALGATRVAAMDVRSYDLAIRPDFSRTWLDIRATLVIDNPERAAELGLELSPRYTSVDVHRGGPGAVTVERDGRRIVLRWTQPRRVERLTFELAGPAGRSEDEERDVIGEHDLFLLWSDRFYPVVFSDWATVRTTLELPPDFEAIAPGRRVQERRDEHGVRIVFETTRPATKFSVFADSRWTRSERTIGGRRMQTLLHPESAKHAEAIFRGSAEVLAFYSELHGGYAFDGFSFVTLEGMYARRAFCGFVGYSPAYLEKEMQRTGHDAHETALLWWGYTTGGRGPGSFQWTEGLGDYVEVLYDEARGLPLPANFERFRSEYLATPADEDVPYSELRGSTPQKIVHGKYPWLMHVMRWVVGDDAFRDGLRLLFERYRFRSFTIDELVSTLEEGTGQPLGWWRREWLERRGAPELTLGWSAEPAEGGGFRIEGCIRQKDSPVRVPIELGIETATGVRVERIELRGSSTPFELVSDAEPRHVVLDPQRWLLIRVVDDPAGSSCTAP